jgi:hypothetical protein
MAVTQLDIARRVGLDVSSVNKILNRRPGPVFRKDTIKQVFKVARELGYDFGRLKYHHKRGAPRRPMAIPLELSIYNSDGTLFDKGAAIIKDVSLSGALLTAVVLPQQSIPAAAPHDRHPHARRCPQGRRDHGPSDPARPLGPGPGHEPRGRVPPQRRGQAPQAAQGPLKRHRASGAPAARRLTQGLVASSRRRRALFLMPYARCFMPDAFFYCWVRRIGTTTPPAL